MLFAREGGGGRARRMMDGCVVVPGGIRTREGHRAGADAVGPWVRMNAGANGDAGPSGAAWLCPAWSWPCCWPCCSTCCWTWAGRAWRGRTRRGPGVRRAAGRGGRSQPRTASPRLARLNRGQWNRLDGVRASAAGMGAAGSVAWVARGRASDGGAWGAGGSVPFCQAASNASIWAMAAWIWAMRRAFIRSRPRARAAARATAARRRAKPVSVMEG
jgi:hypothetical protein